MHPYFIRGKTDEGIFNGGCYWNNGFEFVICEYCFMGADEKR